MECFKIKNLNFAYPNDDENTLCNIELKINQGEFLTIIGPSGCGKTTFLRLLKPAVSPVGNITGEIFFQNENLYCVDEKAQASQIGFVMQSPENQIVTDKVWHELAFGLESLGVKGEEIRAKVAETASFFGIQNWFHKKTSELSGGQKQILNLASVMVTSPQVLILDEPTSQLDPIASQEFFGILKKINRELGTTIILCEHRLEEVFPLSDRVVDMEKGKIVAVDSPKKIPKTLKMLNNDMYFALPSVMRVYGALDTNENYPLNTREGKNWLYKYAKNNEFDKNFEKKTSFSHSKNEIPVVEIKDAYFRYEKNDADILKKLNMKVYKGEIFTILGGNGTGKTTALSLISALNKPYRGKVLINGIPPEENSELYNGVLGVLPQNPQALFVKNTVRSDLLETLKNEALTDEEKEKCFNEICRLCQIEDFLDSHSYDLSGGEQQRTALAKILLKNPKILILDEPTKGMDACFKEKFADILKELTQKNVTVIMVSHDVEFCAKYASRCALFFDGNIVSVDEPQEFFKGKNFYTTTVNRIARDIIPNAVTVEDMVVSFGKKIEERKKETLDFHYEKNEEKQKETEKKERNLLKRIIFSFAFAVVFLFTNFVLSKADNENIKPFIQILTIIEAVGIFAPFCVNKKLVINKEIGKKNKKGKVRKLLISLVTLLLVVATVFVGMYFFKGKKYYFISLLIIFEIMAPIVLNFENSGNSPGKVVTLSVLCAMAVIGREAFVAVPQFKPVMAIVIISAVSFGAEAGFLVGAVSAFLSNFMFGQGPWTPWQMFAFGIVGMFAGIVFENTGLLKTKTSLCVFGGLATFFVYGIIMNISTVIQYQAYPTFSMLVSSCVMGIPFDLVHAFSTVFFLWFVSEPMLEKLERIKTKYRM